MKIVVFGCFLLSCASFIHAAPILQPNDRVAICGDSLTSQLNYAVKVEDYLLMSQPVASLDVAQFGWGGQNARDFLARLNTDLLPYKPTVVLTNFGASNDPNTYRQAQTELVEALKKAGVRIIVIGSPKCVDSVLYHHDPSQADARNKALSALADIDKDVAAKEGVIYADVFGASMAAMTKAKAKAGQDFAFDSDNMWSPTNASGICMAYAYLKALGCNGDIGTITLDYAAGHADATPGHKILSYADNKLTVESSLYPLCYSALDGNPYPIMNSLPFNEELNRFMLVVKNLPTAQTKISWGTDENRDFSSADLAMGINLPAAFDCPFGGKESDVDNGVRNQFEQERILGTAQVQGHADPQAITKNEAALKAARGRMTPVQYPILVQPLAPIVPQPPGLIPVILDTDIGGDVDDAGAVALLNAFMDQGKARLLACVTNTINSDLSSGGTIQAINAYYGHPSIPIGSYHGEPGPDTKMTSVLTPAPPEAYHGKPAPTGSHYAQKIHQQFAPDFPGDDKLPAGVDVYRKALASADDGSVVIVSIGLMQNLQDLIQSQPDSVSDLNGIDLVKKKVRQLVVMANTVHEDAYLLGKWPTPIVWTTFVGTFIGTGQSLIDTPEKNPVRAAYQLFGDEQHNALKDGRQSWDLTAAWAAVNGPGDVWDEVSGHWQVNPPGHFGTWIDGNGKGNDRLLIPKMPYQQVSKLIGDELAWLPDHATSPY